MQNESIPPPAVSDDIFTLSYNRKDWDREFLHTFREYPVWSFFEIFLLLKGFHPFEYKSPGYEDSDEDMTAFLESDYFEIFSRAVISGELRLAEKDMAVDSSKVRKKLYNLSVRPADFFKWASNKKLATNEDFKWLELYKPRHTVALEKQIQIWLTDQFEANLDKPKINKSEYFAQAKVNFPGLTERGFNRAWKNAAQKYPQFIKPGRPKAKKPKAT